MPRPSWEIRGRARPGGPESLTDRTKLIDRALFYGFVIGAGFGASATFILMSELAK